MTYPLERTDVELAQLADELSVRLGTAVRVAARPRARQLDDGSVEPGVLVVVDDATNEETDRFDAGEVADVIASHTPVVPPDPDEEFRAAVEAATTIAALKAALLGTNGPGAQPRQRPAT